MKNTENTHFNRWVTQASGHNLYQSISSALVLCSTCATWQHRLFGLLYCWQSNAHARQKRDYAGKKEERDTAAGIAASNKRGITPEAMVPPLLWSKKQLEPQTGASIILKRRWESSAQRGAFHSQRKEAFKGKYEAQTHPPHTKHKHTH